MSTNRIAVVAAVVTLCVSTLSGQIGGGPAGGGFPGGGRGRAGGAPPANLPETPTAVALPTLSAEENVALPLLLVLALRARPVPPTQPELPTAVESFPDDTRAPKSP